MSLDLDLAEHIHFNIYPVPEVIIRNLVTNLGVRSPHQIMVGDWRGNYRLDVTTGLGLMIRWTEVGHTKEHQFAWHELDESVQEELLESLKRWMIWIGLARYCASYINEIAQGRFCGGVWDED